MRGRPLSAEVSARKDAVLAALRGGAAVRMFDVAAGLGFTQQQSHHALRELAKVGAVKRAGRYLAARWSAA